MEVEWIILADAAEAVNNKLYLIGGGWETITVNRPLPIQHPCAVAVAFSVPWDEADRQHNIEIVIEDQDGGKLVDVAGQIEVGRPAGVPLGRAQRVHMAVKVLLPLQRLGTCAVIARIEGREARRVPFNVVSGPLMAVSEVADDAA